MNANTGGPAFPRHGWSKDPEVLRRMKDQGGMTLLDWYAGQALAAMVEAESKESHKQLTSDGYGSEATYFTRGFADEDYWDGAVKASYACASAMLAEKARREVTGKNSLTVQPREVDDDYWAKFQDGIRIVFQPANGWCAEIREGYMGYGDTIVEAIANLRARWEERRPHSVVQESSTTDHYGDANKMVQNHSPDAGKMVELQAANTAANREVERLRTWLFQFADSHAKLTIANMELVEALEELLESKSKTATRVMEAQDAARAILAKHRGVA